jgi:hypothetical protein
MNLKRFFIVAVLATALATPFYAQAAIIDEDTIAEASTCGQPNAPACSLNVFVKVGVNVANFILGIVGALTLLMFVFGGLTWMLSGGSSSAVQKGKDIIIGSVVGLLIVFASYMIINFVVNNVFEAKNANNKPLFSGGVSGSSGTTQEGPKDCTNLGGVCSSFANCSKVPQSKNECTDKNKPICCVPLKNAPCTQTCEYTSCKEGQTKIDGQCAANSQGQCGLECCNSDLDK